MKISLFYKNVTVLDYAYLDEHWGVVGGSLRVHVEFKGETDEQGVLYDFSYAKKKVKEIIDRDCDHRLIIPSKILVEEGENLSFEYDYGAQGRTLKYKCPSQGICSLPSSHVSQGTISSYLEELILGEMPKTVKGIEISLEEEASSQGRSFFCYTHGLKEHYGNCQRLFHGHRSTVDVFINSLRSQEWENDLALNLFKGSIHFCKWENILNKEEILQVTGGDIPEGRIEHRGSKPLSLKIGYTSFQGLFEAELPVEEVFIMKEETTVENLSLLFARLIKEKVGPLKSVTVRAYEGIGKGAMATI